MKTELISISKIKSNPNNPRLIKDMKFKQLVNSINEFPEMLELRPIVVNDDMVVLWGNMRLKACKEAGLKEVFIIKANDLTEEQQKEFIIKDNIWFWERDMEMLAKDWDEKKLKDWGMDVKFAEVNEWIEEDNYEIPTEIKTNIKEWDFFEIIKWDITHKLICWSSTDEKVLQKLLWNKKANMCFTDPPYLMNFKGAMAGDGTHNEKHEVIMGDNLNKADWDKFLVDFLNVLKNSVGGGLVYFILQTLNW